MQGWRHRLNRMNRWVISNLVSMSGRPGRGAPGRSARQRSGRVKRNERSDVDGVRAELRALTKPGLTLGVAASLLLADAAIRGVDPRSTPKRHGARALGSVRRRAAALVRIVPLRIKRPTPPPSAKQRRGPSGRSTKHSSGQNAAAPSFAVGRLALAATAWSFAS